MSKRATSRSSAKSSASEADNDKSETVVKSETTVKAEVIAKIDIKWKPGQKFPTPSPANGDRVFYETLFEQRPDSEMARDWCIAYGILDVDQINKILKGNNSKGSSSPVKKSVTAKRNATVTTTTTSKRKKLTIDEDVGDDDDAGDKWERQGATTV